MSNIITKEEFIKVAKMLCENKEEREYIANCICLSCGKEIKDDDIVFQDVTGQIFHKMCYKKEC